MADEVRRRRRSPARPYVLGLFLFLAVLGSVITITAYLEPVEPSFTSDTSYKKQTPGYRAGGAQCEPAALAKITPALSRSREADACKQAEEEHRIKVYDLEQQRRSADAAQKATTLTFIQTRAGVLGTTFEFFTFVATVVGLVVAINSLKTGVVSTRGWLDVDVVPNRTSTASDQLTISANVIIKNVGAAPASDIRLGHYLFAFRPPDHELLTIMQSVELANQALVAQVIPPSAEQVVERVVTLAWGENSGVDSDVGVLPIVGVGLLYTLLNGEEGKTVRWFQLGARHPGSGPAEVDLVPLRFTGPGRGQNRLTAKPIGYSRME